MASSLLHGTSALLVVLALSAAGCSSPEAAAAPDPAPASSPIPTLEAGSGAVAPSAGPGAPAAAVPDLAGMNAHDAHAVLRDIGVQIQAIAFDESLVVTAQYPEPGGPALPGVAVTVWLGTPPAPAPAAESVPSSATEAAAAELASIEAAGPAPPPDSAPPPAKEAPEPPKSDGGAPTPARTSPRRQPPAEVGTVLQGLASWYGPGFEGRGTACGQKFDPNALTMASRELRCGTRVLVTGPGGASVEAVVNDWGPAEWTNRRFDLSRATFEAIHPLGAGVVSVTVEVLAP